MKPQDESLEMSSKLGEEFAAALQTNASRSTEEVFSKVAEEFRKSVEWGPIGLARTKKSFRDKLQKVVDLAGIPQFPTAIRLGGTKRSPRVPGHHEKAIITEAYFSITGDRPVLTDWRRIRVGYGTANGFAMAVIKKTPQDFITTSMFVGVAKCHSSEPWDWEFGCMLALYRAAQKMFLGRG